MNGTNDISKAEALELNKDIVNKQQGINPTTEQLLNAPKTRDDLYQKIRKWIYLPDTKRIDIILAVSISVYQEGKPLWVFFVGGSGDAKSELIKPLEKLPYARKIDQLTANTLATGKKNAHDLGSELEHNHTLLLFTDLACLTSLNKDEKKKIWGQFRTLFDGDIFKDTGSGVHKAYEECHVNILACTTSAIKDEYHIHQQLGTRELLFDTDPDPRHNTEKMRHALNNRNKQKQMRKEIEDAILGFLADKEFNENIEIPSEIIDFLFRKCEKLRLLRATGKTDWKTGELDADIEAEVTTRLIQQFGLLYQSLYSLDENYPEKRFKAIIEHFVKSSSQPVRYKLYQFFTKNNDWFKIFELHQRLKNSRTAIKAECEALWNLGFLDKKYEYEEVGYEGSNRYRDVAYYSILKKIDQQERII